MSTLMNLEGQMAILAALGIDPVGVETVNICLAGGQPPRVVVLRHLRDDQGAFVQALQQFRLVADQDASASAAAVHG